MKVKGKNMVVGWLLLFVGIYVGIVMVRPTRHLICCIKIKAQSNKQD